MKIHNDSLQSQDLEEFSQLRKQKCISDIDSHYEKIIEEIRQEKDAKILEVTNKINQLKCNLTIILNEELKAKYEAIRKMEIFM